MEGNVILRLTYTLASVDARVMTLRIEVDNSQGEGVLYNVGAWLGAAEGRLGGRSTC